MKFRGVFFFTPTAWALPLLVAFQPWVPNGVSNTLSVKFLCFTVGVQWWRADPLGFSDIWIRPPTE